MERASNITMYGGSWIAVIAGLSLSDWGVIIGIILGVFGFISNEAHKAHIREIERKKLDMLIKERQEKE